MSNLSTAIRYDHTATANPNLVDWSTEYCERDNAEFFAGVGAALRKMGKSGRKGSAGAATVDPGGALAIVLVGEYGYPAYRLRTAQGALRVDRTPSNWSHALLLHEALSADAAVLRDPTRSPLVLQATLSGGAGLGHFAFKSGVSVSRLSDYARADFDVFAERSVPNVAVLFFALTASERDKIADRSVNPDADQLGYDLPGQLGVWFSYVTSRGALANPLATGVGLASASYVQLAYDAAGIGLSPGAQQRNITPEHIWQAARFLHRTFKRLDGGEQLQRFVGGFSCVRDRACVQAPVDQELPRSLSELIASVEGGSRAPGGRAARGSRAAVRGRGQLVPKRDR